MDVKVGLMADIFNKRKRSEIMSRVKGKNTKPEMAVRKFLHANGFRYRIHDKALPGSPDIKLTKYKTVILINGCFWHGHSNCDASSLPVTNTEYWKSKVERNKARDEKNLKKLKEMGWRVITVWECELKPKVVVNNLESLLLKILAE